MLQCNDLFSGRAVPSPGAKGIVGIVFMKGGKKRTAMAKNNDKDGELDALAKRYLDLWESQLAALGSDRELAEAMARTARLMNSGAGAFFEGITKATHGATAEPTAGAETNNARATAAAPIDGHSDHDLADFNRRLERLEKRLDQLEAGTGAGGKRPGRGTRKETRRRKS